MRRNELRDRINAHQILSIPKDERCQHEVLRMDMMKLLMEYMRFSDRLEDQLSEQKVRNFSALADEEQRMVRADGRGQQGLEYDGVAFTEAAIRALKGYDSEKNCSFLAWFCHIYRQQLIHARWTPRAIKYATIERPRLKGRELAIYRSCIDILQRQGITPDQASDELVDRMAKAIKIDAKKLRKILDLFAAKPSVELSTTGEVGSDEEEGMVNPEDSSSAKEFNHVENALALASVLDLLKTVDEQEYPRLFFSNIFLRPLKDDEDPDQKGYKRIMLANEKLLWDCVFVKNYLEFTLQEPPKPDSVENIIECEIKKYFINKTIAEFQGCSEANVSQQYAKFKELQKRLRIAAEILRE